MPASRKKPIAQPFEVPYPPDRVWGPTVVYDYSGEASLQYTADEEKGHVRVMFEGFDALRVCRGKHLPYRAVRKKGMPGSRVYLVDHSHWLKERHAYEAEHSRDRHESGGNVDELLTEHEHYLFAFHDQYVEVLARGIWFEWGKRRFARGAPSPQHPLAALPPSAVTHRFTVAGLKCQVRTNPLPMDELLRLARYCSQPLFHLVLEADALGSVWMRMDVRVRRGEVRSTWRNQVGTARASFPGVATQEQVKALAEAELREVARRRKELGR